MVRLSSMQLAKLADLLTSFQLVNVLILTLASTDAFLFIFWACRVSIALEISGPVSVPRRAQLAILVASGENHRKSSILLSR